MPQITRFVPLPGFLLVLAACSGEPLPAEPEAVVVNQSPRVNELFESMAASTYADRWFPELDWDDIPALLELGPSTRMLEDIPRNSLSSQYEERCVEGLVALWLVEGIRKGGVFASLNSLCFAGKVEGSDWTGASEANHDRALAAYKHWWSKVQDLPQEEAAEIDPLQGTGLYWY